MKQEELFCTVPVTTQRQIDQTAELARVIWHECFEKYLPAVQVELMVSKNQSAGAIREQIEQGQAYYLLYFDGAPEDEPGGYVAVKNDGKKLLLSKMYILEPHRGKGYAHEILAFVEGLARDAGCNGVWLTVNRQNERAIAVYRHTGFDKVGEEQVDVGGGYIVDDFIFEKPL